MTAQSSDRNTKWVDGEYFDRQVAAGVTIYLGAAVVLNASGYAQPATTASGLVADGIADTSADNLGGGNGDTTVRVHRGVFLLANSSGGDLITLAEIGDLCYFVDDKTVAKTDGTGTRSVAGKVENVDSQGVWVKF